MSHRYSLPLVTLALLAAACTERADTAAGTADTTGAMAADTTAGPGMTTDTALTVGNPPAPAGAMLNPDSASREQLLAVPGMTPAAADALIAGRPHADMRAVNRALSSLSEPARDSVFSRVWKPIDLNSATAEEITLIPGVGDRMRHEFEEYRPYTSMAQFRREIGKYVDEAEVARLEKYVTIRQ